jgi:MoxR-like ATPase
MPHLATNAARVATPSHRAQLVAEAVVSAYIDEIARSARPPQRAMPAPPRAATARTRAAGHRRALTRRRRPVAIELGA